MSDSEQSSDSEVEVPTPAPKKAAPGKKKSKKAAEGKKAEGKKATEGKKAAGSKKALSKKAADAEKAEAPAKKTNKRKMKIEGETATAKKTKTEEGDEAGSNRCVFVSGLSYEAVESNVREFFSDCGEITDLRIPTFEDSGRARGIAFVEFADDEGFKKALDKDEETFMGRYLKISVSTGHKKKDTSFIEKEPSARPEGCKNVFVGNLSWKATESELRELFEECGNPISVRIAWNAETGQSRGFGHVEFDSEDAVDKAIEKTGTVIAGRPIRVDFAGARAPNADNEDKPRSGGFRGRGRGRGGRGRGGRGRGGRGRGRGGAK